MKKEIPYRKKEMYTTPDGRIVEAWEKMGTVTVEVEDDYEDDMPQDNVYIGVFPIPHPVLGFIERHFDLGNPSTLEEAFERYVPIAKQIRDSIERAQKEHERQIITAPAEVLNQLGNRIIDPSQE